MPLRSLATLVTLPDSLGIHMDVIRFTGSYYKQIGFPRGCDQLKDPDKARRIFRYSSYEVLESHYE